MTKRILFLGASYFQIPPIRYAQQQGYHVITADYLPANPGHKYADEYHNVNATDLDAVLDLSEQLNIDAIVAYASDPCAPTAAYVAENLNLPGNPYESVQTLVRKDLFRDFLQKNKFQTPRAVQATMLTELECKIRDLNFPLVIKPVDSSGSKGVSVINTLENLPDAFAHAYNFSRTKAVIAEEYVEMDGYQIAGDGFVMDGNLVFRCFANEHFDYSCNGLVPIGESFPYTENADVQQQVHDEVQRVLDLLNMKTGALNFDVRIDPAGNVQLMEIGPRNGGNLIPEVIRYITGVDMIKYSVEAALGNDCSGLQQTVPKGFYASYIMHAQSDGIIDRFEYSDEIKPCIVEEVRWFKEGDTVNKFKGSNCTLGTQILKFDTQEQMLHMMDNMNAFQKVVLR